MKTARMTIMLEPDEKARIEGRAREHDISTGEYVRRASQSYEEVDEEMLDAFLTRFHSEMDAMHATLAKSHERTQAVLAEVDALRASVHGPR